MARFLMSPGVITREIDASQYTVTTATGTNSVALVGYAEKGPFDPVLVSDRQDFENTFGTTLSEAPYLAMTAYKIFDEGQQILVVRAGDERDPDVVPYGAAYASKEIRVTPAATQINATTGYEEFKNSDVFLPENSFTAGGSYKFNLLADDKAFKTSKYVEKWAGHVYETYNGIGETTHSVLQNIVAKIACDASDSKSFSVDYKSLNATVGSSGEYSGTGTREGSALGNAIIANITRYRTNNTYEAVETDTLKLNCKYGAVALGNVNLSAGHDFSVDGAAGSFAVTVGTTTATFTLNKKFGTIDELLTELNSQLGNSSLSGLIEFTRFSEDGGSTFYLVIRRTGSGGASNMTLASGSPDSLVILGFVPGEYLDSKGIYGTWTGTAPITGPSDIKEFAGSIILTWVSSQNAAESFEDKVELSLTAPSTGKWDKSVIKDQLNAAILNAYSQYTNGASARATASLIGNIIRISTLSSNTDTTKSIVRITTPSTSGASLIDLLDGVNTPQDGVDAQYKGESIINLIANEKGSYGNKLSFKVESGTKKISMTESIPTYNVYVYYDGTEVASYVGIYWGDGTAKDSKGNLIGKEAEMASSNYILTKMASDSYITIEAEDENGNSTMGRLPDGTWTLGDGDLPSGVLADQAEIIDYQKGTNGWQTDSNGSITSMSADFVNALEKITNPEVYDFNLIAAPGDASTIVQNAIQDLCESRRDCFGIIDAAPFGLGLGIRNNTIHISKVNDSCSNLTSSYVGAYWPWLQDYDSDNKAYVWLPPSTYALRQIVYTDSVSDPWQAPAGNTRGRVSDAVDIEYSPSSSDRDILYGEGCIVNPIVKFINEGITIWGQKTAQRTNTSTNRINVRRLLIYAERLVAKMARSFLFEPNDSTNWASFARQANSILEPIRQRRGLYTYSVVCDSTTNTDDLVNQNIMSGKIFLQPMKTIEFIEVSFTVNAATGETTVQE